MPKQVQKDPDDVGFGPFGGVYIVVVVVIVSFVEVLSWRPRLKPGKRGETKGEDKASPS